MELRKIFVRKLLATCTSFSEGILWLTISIFTFLGSRGNIAHTHTYTQCSPTTVFTYSRRQETDGSTSWPGLTTALQSFYYLFYQCIYVYDCMTASHCENNHKEMITVFERVSNIQWWSSLQLYGVVAPSIGQMYVLWMLTTAVSEVTQSIKKKTCRPREIGDSAGVKCFSSSDIGSINVTVCRWGEVLVLSLCHMAAGGGSPAWGRGWGRRGDGGLAYNRESLTQSDQQHQPPVKLSSACQTATQLSVLLTTSNE